MQTIRGTRGRRPISTAVALAAGLVLAVSLNACGDDDGRCDRRFSDVPDIQACNVLGETFNCKNAVYSNCNIPAGEASSTESRTTPSSSQASCETAGTNFATTIATRLANEVAAGPIAEFDCGGRSFTQDDDVTAVFDAETMMCTVDASVTVDVTVTACLICDPPKQEPRCVLSGCLECEPLDDDETEM